MRPKAKPFDYEPVRQLLEEKIAMGETFTITEIVEKTNKLERIGNG